MLESLNNQIVGDYRVRVERIGAAKYFDQYTFGIFLIDARGKSTDAPVFRGLFNAGRPSIHVKGWIDGEFVEQVQSPESKVQSPLTMELAEQLAEKIGGLIPPGGIFWLAYESYAEGALMRETRQALDANIPLLATPIGFLLYRANCWLGLKNWHFPEGGREGPMKLQGNKALNDDHARVRARESSIELKNFLAQPASTELQTRAHDRARIILPALEKIGNN